MGVIVNQREEKCHTFCGKRRPREICLRLCAQGKMVVGGGGRVPQSVFLQWIPNARHSRNTEFYPRAEGFSVFQ